MNQKAGQLRAILPDLGQQGLARLLVPKGPPARGAVTRESMQSDQIQEPHNSCHAPSSSQLGQGAMCSDQKQQA
eukprot:333746-Pelagomonas_calceolata.AAC.2